MKVNWHNRFVQQAAWTRDLRDYLYQRAGLSAARHVLEVGCGTGVLLAELLERIQNRVVGVDLEMTRVQASAINAPQAGLVQADGQNLPFLSGAFDLAVCHFLLLWVKKPALLLKEMQRVTRQGGAVLALAEPDYGGRIDYPDALIDLGKQQKQSLEIQGADPLIGRKLNGLFHQAGFREIETGVLGAQWSQPPSKDDLDQEWAVLQDDLRDLLDQQEIEKMRSLEINSWERGERVLFVPTFYAWGRV